MELGTSVGNLPLVGPSFEKKLANLGIYTLEHLLFHFPYRYEDFSLVSPIWTLQEGETVSIQGTITKMKNEFTRNRKFIQKGTIQDDTGEIGLVWFNQTYLTRNLKPGTKVSISGTVSKFGSKLSFISPEYEIIYETADSLLHTARIVPIYHETHGVSSKWFRNKMKVVLDSTKPFLQEYLPQKLIQDNELVSLSEALEKVHFPKSMEDVAIARKRLAFDEFFLIQAQVLLRKKSWEEEKVAEAIAVERHEKNLQKLIDKLPFELTNAQKQAIAQMKEDFTKKTPMNRLLEGDVGSGKTVVAAIGMYLMHLAGYQSALMAPTSILAVQHHKTIQNLLEPLGVRVALVTGSQKPKKGEEMPHILVGTHALLHDTKHFDRLAFVVIDEQHRFGVEQRGILMNKGSLSTYPHTLTMTATPIPRTVALTMYGNLALTHLHERPKGRIPIKTWVVTAEKRDGAYEWIEKEIEEEGAQVFIICPFIEESENMTTVKSALKEYETIVERFPNKKVALLHGKMKAKEKDEVMAGFRNREYDILVATPVVEVGVDIPGATIILIEGAERFGLAQLHQLRGRVGRNDQQSYCLLFTSDGTRGNERLRSMETIDNGAELAELDLKLRGPGEITGTRQSGVPALKIASFSDFELIEQTRNAAEKYLKEDPTLKEAPLLKIKIESSLTQIIEPN